MKYHDFRKKNHQIWSSYEGEIPITKFHSGLKRKKMNHMCVLCCRASVYYKYVHHITSSQAKACRSGKGTGFFPPSPGFDSSPGSLL